MKAFYDEKSDTIWSAEDCAEDCFMSIMYLAADYDGCGDSKKGLRSLVDELSELAHKGRMFLEEGKARPDRVAEAESYNKARMEATIARLRQKERKAK